MNKSILAFYYYKQLILTRECKIKTKSSLTLISQDSHNSELFYPQNQSTQTTTTQKQYFFKLEKPNKHSIH